MRYIYLVLALISVLLVSVGVQIAIWTVIPDMPTRGQFGDMFGAANAIFSGLAFLGVIVAIALQRDELRLQREELKLTRQELSRAAKAREKAERALSKQADSLKKTAKLNGLSAMLQHQNALIEISNHPKYGINGGQFEMAKREADRQISEIKKIIESK